MTEQDWRIRWAGLLGILFVVPDALHKVDSKRDANIDAARKEWWDGLTWNPASASLLLEFIQPQRHGALHRYEFFAERTEARTGWVGGWVGDWIGPAKVQHFPITEPGPYLARDAREVAAEAIEWLEKSLDWVERRAAEVAAKRLTSGP